MATLTDVKVIHTAPGWTKISARITGPSSYLTATKDPLDLSDYFEEVRAVSFSGVVAAANALIKADWFSADGAPAAGVVVYTWGGGDAAVFKEVTNTTDLDGYTFWITAEGFPLNSVVD